MSTQLLREEASEGHSSITRRRCNRTDSSCGPFQSNLHARRFYEERGFVAVAMTTGDNEEQSPDVCYEWRPAWSVTRS